MEVSNLLDELEKDELLDIIRVLSFYTSAIDNAKFILTEVNKASTIDSTLRDTIDLWFEEYQSLNELSKQVIHKRTVH